MYNLYLISSGLLSEEVTMLVVRSLLALFLGSPTYSSSSSSSSNNNSQNSSSSRSHSNLIEGTFQLESAHNFEAYLAELGVNIILRRLASLANPTVTISR